MRLFLTTAFVGIGLCVSNAAEAGTFHAHRLQTDSTDFRFPPACTQIEKQVGVDPIACGIYSSEELTKLQLAEENHRTRRLKRHPLRQPDAP